MDEASRHRLFEERFLAQLRAKALGLTRGKLPADTVSFEPSPEGVDAVRAELGRLGVYDRNAIEKVAGTRSAEMLFQKKALGGLFYHTVSKVRIRVLAAVGPLLKGEKPGPVGREDVLDALARYEVLPKRDRPSGVIFASATGFTPEARALAETSGQPTVVLMGAREDGGWDVSMPSALKKTPWSRLFELESQDERLKRLLYHLNQSADLVDSRGLRLDELAEKLSLSQAETELLVRQAIRGESRLMTVVHAGQVHVCRTPLAEVGTPMSLWSRVRRLLRMKPTVAERVKEMTVQRVRVEQERHEIDQKVDALEGQERQAVQQGASATNDVERKQAASKLVRIRTELKRQRTQAQLYTQQIDIIGTHIHHLTLAEKGKRLELPRAEDLTREAAAAERVISEVSANADLARSIEVGGPTPMMEEEEAAIFEEFKQAAAEKAASSAGGAAAGDRDASAGPTAPASERAAQASASANRPSGQRTPPLPTTDREKAARPEMG